MVLWVISTDLQLVLLLRYVFSLKKLCQHLGIVFFAPLCFFLSVFLDTYIE